MNSSPDVQPSSVQTLVRAIGVPHAVLLGLGSILGTGVFVSIALAWEITGATVVLAVALAAVVALCNGLSSAQLAASHPKSGGTYEYGYRYLSPAFGFSAGFLFLCAKSASAATAARGFAGYLLESLGAASTHWRDSLPLLAVVFSTCVVVAGVRRSNRVNAVIVAVTVGSLLAFIAGGLSAVKSEPLSFASLVDFENVALGSFLEATGLMFVAYTGYGRIATLGEEVKKPEKTIPRAIIVTLFVSMSLYVLVAFVLATSSSVATFEAGRAPLETLASTSLSPWLGAVVALGAMVAMLGVLQNLILGLSRVVLAMARRGELPRAFSALDAGQSPRRAVVLVGVVIGLAAFALDVQASWTFSAFTVLVYYGLTNLAALRLPSHSRTFPRWISVLGLASCLGLAAWVDVRIWVSGLSLLAVGLLWHVWARRQGWSGPND